MSFRLYLTNWTSAALLGPGDMLGIMLRPRSWELQAEVGRVGALVPNAEDLDAVRLGRISSERYREFFESRVSRPALEPGVLSYVGRDGKPGTVLDGDSLLCACSVEAALAGRCHRTYSAGLLAAAGWSVVADGFLLEACDCVPSSILSDGPTRWRGSCARCLGRGWTGEHPYLNPAQRSLL